MSQKVYDRVRMSCAVGSIALVFGHEWHPHWAWLAAIFVLFVVFFSLYFHRHRE